MKSDFSIPIRYGLIGALAVTILSIVTYLFYDKIFTSLGMVMAYGLFAFALLLFIPILGGVTYKRAQAGDLPFGKAFVAVFIIYAITVTTSSVISFVLPNYIDTDYPVKLHEMVANTTRESMEKYNMPDDKIEAELSKMKLDRFKPTPVTALTSYAQSLGVGIVLCLIIAIFVKRKHKIDTPTLDQYPPAS
jgi:hypothetical protein